MKIRIGFVSNSSSSSFLVTNRTDKRIGEKKFLNLLSFIPERFVDYILERKGDLESYKYFNNLFYNTPRDKILPKRLKPYESIVVEFGNDKTFQSGLIESCVISLYPKMKLVTEELEIKFLESFH